MLAESREPIAIVGIGLRTAGANSHTEFWRLLCDGQDAIGEAPGQRWEAERLMGSAADTPRLPHLRGGFVDQVDHFDWRAFRIPPREAEQLDPQQRLLLETAWEALEDAGIPFHQLRGTRSAVFVGMNPVDYQRLLARDWSRLDGYTVLGTTAALAANRISHMFGLTGPSLVLNMACASSLAAVHYACQSLWTGDAVLALAGGVELMLSPDSSIMLAEAGMVSPSGRHLALDARADGYARGEGVGILVLRRLSDLLPGDRVYAVVRGSALNHNGPGAWVTDTSADAQANVIRAACDHAAIAPRQVDYMELHGSALPKGDRAEIVALGASVGGHAGRVQPCRIGTLTNNIGYLGAAGGVVGVIKVALALHHELLPPTINVESPYLDLDLGELGLQLQTAVDAWPRGPESGLAGVLSTSLGGANACVIVSGSAPEVGPVGSIGREDTGLHVLPLSAHTAQTLRAQAERFTTFLSSPGTCGAALEDVCYTASVRRTHHPHRMAVVGDSHQQLRAQLEAARKLPPRASSPGSGPHLVFVYTPWDERSKELVRRLRHSWSPLRAAASDELSCPDALASLWAACGVRPDATVRFEDHVVETGQLSRLADALARGKRTCFLVIGPHSDTTATVRRYVGQQAEADLLYTLGSAERAERTFLETLASLYVNGLEVTWEGLFPHRGRCVDLPPYPFQKQRFWPEWLTVAEVSSPPGRDNRAGVSALAEQVEPGGMQRVLQVAPPQERAALLGRCLLGCVLDLLPLEPDAAPSPGARLFDLGLTSVLLVQLARRLERDLQVSLPMSVFFEHPTLALLGQHLLTIVQTRPLSPPRHDTD